MSKVICKTPDCGSEIDTVLACQNITSLFGLRKMLEDDLENTNTGSTAFKEKNQFLGYVKRQIEDYRLDDETTAFEGYKLSLYKNAAAPSVRQLYIQCPKGHRHFYDVVCNPSTVTDGN